MLRYTAISIIYNPHSTGPSKELAKKLQTDLRERLPEQEVGIIPTDRARHAEELAYSLAKASKRPLIISSSGDGGYHEVINGLMKAQNEGYTPVAGLLPAGNANDHFNYLHESDIVELIVSGHEKQIDLLEITTIKDALPITRYAHSYIGVGLTPEAGKELNKAQLNKFREVWIVIRVLINLKAVRLRIKGKLYTYDSLIFSNVGKMSKILRLSDQAEINDGKFEVTAFRRRNKLALVSTLIKASTNGIRGNYQRRVFRFTTTTPTLVQFDGEVGHIDAGSLATIRSIHRAIRCIV